MVRDGRKKWQIELGAPPKKIGIEITLPLLPNNIAKLIKLLKSLLNY